MKKLSLKKLSLEANDLLQREQLKTVFGGYSNGPCSIYDTAFGRWMPGYSVEDAQWFYNNEPEVKGYCCASC